MRIGLNVCKSLIGLVLAVSLVACSDSTNLGQARLKVVLTDAPGPYVGAAVVSFGEISIKNDAEEWMVLVEDGPDDVDLLELQNGVTLALADLELPEGVYLEARAVVESAVVTLESPYEFNDGTTSRVLKVPSGMQSGIKMKLDDADGDPDTPGFELVGEMVLVFDFDVMQNFRVQGNPHTPAGIKSVLFTPVIRAIVRDVAGSISGTVTDQDTNPLDAQIVKGVLTDSEIFDPSSTAAVTAMSVADGTYSLLFLRPGIYDVTVIEIVDDTENVLAGPETVEVGESEDVEDVDFTVDTSGS